jgi:hypothetical protein
VSKEKSKGAAGVCAIIHSVITRNNIPSCWSSKGSEGDRKRGSFTTAAKTNSKIGV